jgi:hypothetical protein
MPDHVVHMVGRPGSKTADVPASIAAASPEVRLWHILRGWRIRGFPTYYSFGGPVICFTEARPEAIGNLIDGGYAPWGLVFPKQAVWKSGGAPVGYIRKDEWNDIAELPPRIRARFVRLELGEEDWTHEREWRIVGDEFRFNPGTLSAILVGDRDWTFTETVSYIDARTGSPQTDYIRAEWLEEVPVLEYLPDGTWLDH